jgi:REP element-mobilizing transposase RayT
MSVRKKITEPNGVFFITFTCARWLHLFRLTNGYKAVYKWFDYLKAQGHCITGYVIMSNHVHVMIGFRTSRTSINTLVANGKRFMAYELVKKLEVQGKKEMLELLASYVTKTERLQNKKHTVFQPSFDWKECFSLPFMKQKADYMHLNPCRAGLVKLPEDYAHSSATYYYTGEQGIYPVMTYMELQDIDLTSRIDDNLA